MTQISPRARTRAALVNAGTFLENITDDQLERAQLVVAGYATDENDLRELLQLLGICRNAAGRHFREGTIFGYWRHVNREESPCLNCWNARMAELERMWISECPMIPRDDDERRLPGETSTTDDSSRTSS